MVTSNKLEVENKNRLVAKTCGVKKEFTNRISNVV